ncbi:MAG: nitroreductase family protein [Spirochaetaceae bacterium]|nr:nitroreductase family protein [Spirochaetaceae bacterium]
MKKIIFFACTFAAIAVSAGAQENPALRTIINHYAARNFTSGAVSKADLDLVIQAGIRSPSAANRQPWHFTVVQTPDLARRIVSNITEGNVLIVISAPGDGKTNGVQILDCALAAQSIYLAAQALGLGSRIYTGPVDAVNSQLKSVLGLPAGHSVIVIVRIGRVAPVDTASAASARNSADALVTYK